MPNKNKETYDKRLLWIAAGIGLLGNLSANFIWETANNETRLAIGLVSLLGFFALFFCLSKGWGSLNC